MKYKGTFIKQINNLKIKRLQEDNYFVVSPLPSERILKTDMTFEEAELFCRNCKDFIIKKGNTDG